MLLCHDSHLPILGVYAMNKQKDEIKEIKDSDLAWKN